tara:strand:- start:3 stop:2042 length:2040 start_codon:yes stop_codon:yes gene_type:complete
MANSFVRYTGNGSTTAYSIPFSYRSTADLTVTLAGVATTAFTLNAAGTTVTFNTAPANNVAIEIRRRTSQGTKLVDYASGSVLTESDLDTDSDQAFFMSQEAIDDAGDVIKIDATNFQWDAQNKRLTNLANPTSDQDAATKHYLENTWLSASDKATLNNVNSNIAAINTVNSNMSAITTTNSNATNINIVANNMPSVTTVATDISKVIAVANDLAEAVSEVETVADDLNETTSEIDTVAGSIANVDIVGNAIANVNTVAGLNTEITNLDNIKTDITGVNNISADVTAVKNNETNINTVAGLNTEIGLLGTSGTVASINNVSTNLSDINSFENSYKISASAPTGVAEGTLWFDTANDIMKVYDGSAFQNAGSSVNGTSQRNKFTATANQTAFTGNDDDGVALAYDPNFLDVYLNGVRIINGSDYTATDGSTITLTAGASVGDILSVVSFGTFNIASFSATAITSDTLDANRLPNIPDSKLPVVPITKGGTGLSSVSGQSGKALVVNSSSNGFDLANTSSAEVYGLEMYYNPSTINIAVSVQNVGGSNKYFIDGVQQKTLELYEGNTYVFTHPSAHPFRFSTDSGNTSAYTTGVTVDSSTQVTIVVASGAPTLYYYCSSHSGMGGQANTPVPANNSLQVTTTNQGVDSINSTQFDSFDDVLFSASGFTFSLNNNGRLIATV